MKKKRNVNHLGIFLDFTMVNVDESTVHEYPFIKTIEAKCKQCRISITNFSNLKSVSRQSWSTSYNTMQWNITYEITMYGEIFCECGNYLGYESDITEWRLMKKNVVLEY